MATARRGNLEGLTPHCLRHAIRAVVDGEGFNLVIAWEQIIIPPGCDGI
jgi:hypothetical protein